ncbi:helix-turn-helix domain-containing protein [Staphylococcus simiae]|uniref:helix-turn-helix domain-containing protein n=1 Tax=Staphylococcus simiae TaxID=308354 RepID=UPI001A976360|nr:helix-turn-helix domain-containing protein [Staphylococcus simiae]MBO1199088.1 helix-turn-helix domain-containing protein [Staphylococcus simiae]MBO1201204.1 helix-turn-helix domain-containing protein [Staphylococcus simiae]MBO1203353.1 helix-turn-helix domain-containing protein [Staphylococcus simiae]MBO1210880.1 helix-turn-helix domain-containing protein [Staphylococcus simiae]MBO1229526.1 helix-turn-helix domain-containing protein [Staphylococcus simiae]
MKSSFSARLKEAMKKNNMKQVDIINKVKSLNEFNDIKISKTDLSQYVNGKTTPGQKKLYVLAKILNVNEAWLLGYNVDSLRISDDSRNVSRNKEKIYAHIKSDVTKEEMEEIINFIDYVNSKRTNQQNNSDK